MSLTANVLNYTHIPRDVSGKLLTSNLGIQDGTPVQFLEVISPGVPLLNCCCRYSQTFLGIYVQPKKCPT